MPSHSRSRSPLRSLKVNPVSWTRVPGAWLRIRIRAEADTRTTGRGPSGRYLAQTRQARISVSRASSRSGADWVAARMAAYPRSGIKVLYFNGLDSDMANLTAGCKEFRQPVNAAPQ